MDKKDEVKEEVQYSGVPIYKTENLRKNSQTGSLKLSPTQQKFLKFEKLPTANIPKQLLEMNPNWKIQPHFQFSSNEILILIGANAVSFSVRSKYVCWEKFLEKCNDYLESFYQTGIANSFYRVSLRYINFIDGDIFKLGNYSINCNNLRIESDSENIKFRMREANSNVVILSIMNDATITSSFKKDFVGKHGSIIDIDSSREGCFTKESLNELICSIHESSKKHFFMTIGTELLNSFKPCWE